MSLKIKGTGSYVPEQILTNADLEKMVETNDEWIRTRTGIEERRLAAPEQATSDLAAIAVQRALEMAGIPGSELDAIIVATITPDHIFPSTACILQQKFGAVRAFCFDLEAACSGLVYSLEVARSLMKTNAALKHVLVVGAEKISSVVNWEDRNTCVLFGDGAGAAIFRLADTPFALTLGARGSDVLHAGGPSREGSAPITMDGKAVFRFAVDALPKCLHTVLDETRLTLEDLSWVVCHQANSRIIDHCIKALQADPAKFYKNMDRHGNTSAASIPVALNELAESGQLTPGKPLACIGFGGGLTWGGAILQYKE